MQQKLRWVFSSSSNSSSMTKWISTFPMDKYWKNVLHLPFLGAFLFFFLMSCSWFFCLNHWIPIDGNGASTNQLLMIQTSTLSHFPLDLRSSFHLRGIPMETLQHASPHSNSRICIKKKRKWGTFKYKMKDILWFVLGVTIQISKEKRFFSDKKTIRSASSSCASFLS